MEKIEVRCSSIITKKLMPFHFNGTVVKVIQGDLVIEIRRKERYEMDIKYSSGLGASFDDYRELIIALKELLIEGNPFCIKVIDLF